jgi:hypothetical protein
MSKPTCIDTVCPSCIQNHSVIHFVWISVISLRKSLLDHGVTAWEGIQLLTDFSYIGSQYQYFAVGLNPIGKECCMYGASPLLILLDSCHINIWSGYNTAKACQIRKSIDL